MGTNLVIVGCQMGDEGKGKFTDVLCEQADAVVRYQAGPQTGHTVVTADGEFRFSQVPSGVLRKIVGVLGNGCVVDPERLVEECESLKRRSLNPDLRISESAHVVMPYHILQDAAMEAWRGDKIAISPGTGCATGEGRIGSTQRGVGPCREDKIARIGIRMIDLLDRDVLRARLRKVLPMKRALIENVYGGSGDRLDALTSVESLVDRYHEYGLAFAESLCDVSRFLSDARDRGDFLLYEGTQSVGLDIDHGTYPYVSTGFSAAGGVTAGTGTPPTVAFRVVGVAKAYSARVGGGPLPTALSGETSDHLVERGREYGTVTGRRRRVGWLDLCMLRRSIRIDGVEALCITNLDVLAGLDEVKVATKYLVDSQPVWEFPASLSACASADPVYEVLPGWTEEDWDVAGGIAGLPRGMRDYLQFISDELSIPVVAAGVGPRRDQTAFAPDWELAPAVLTT